MSQESTKLLHSINQTTEITGFGRNTVYKLADSNELTLIKIGRRSFITDDSIHALIDRKVVEAQDRSSLDNDPNCIKARAARSKADAA